MIIIGMNHYTSCRVKLADQQNSFIIHVTVSYMYNVFNFEIYLYLFNI